MSSKSDYTEEQWETILHGPANAGMLVVMSSGGGMFRESMALAKTYAEARQQHGESQLLDEVSSSKPKAEHKGIHSVDELKVRTTEGLTQALTAMNGKATPEEIDEYKKFVVTVATNVAKAHKEDGQEISPEEQATLDELVQTLGTANVSPG